MSQVQPKQQNRRIDLLRMHQPLTIGGGFGFNADTLVGTTKHTDVSFEESTYGVIIRKGDSSALIPWPAIMMVLYK